MKQFENVGPEKKKQNPIDITDADLLDERFLDQLLGELPKVEFVDVPEDKDVYQETTAKAVEGILRAVNEYVEKEVKSDPTLSEKQRAELDKALRPILYRNQTSSADQWRSWMLGLLKENKIDDFNSYAENLKKKKIEEIDEVVGKYYMENSTTH